jgi:hypothetical protein
MSSKRGLFTGQLQVNKDGRKVTIVTERRWTPKKSAK